MKAHSKNVFIIHLKPLAKGCFCGPYWPDRLRIEDSLSQVILRGLEETGGEFWSLRSCDQGSVRTR